MSPACCCRPSCTSKTTWEGARSDSFCAASGRRRTRRSGAFKRNWASRWSRYGPPWERRGRVTRGCWGICGRSRRITEMKIPINLASQPFRRDRALLAGSIAVCAVLVLTLGALVSLGVADHRQMADTRAEIARLNARVRTLTAEQADVDAVLRKPENAEVLEGTAFLNDLLARKGISWTRIFADLEKVLPYNVRLIQIHPAVDAQNRVTLDMQVGSESPEPVIKLLQTMAQAPFGRPELKLQQTPTQAEPLYRYRVSVGYGQKL